MEFKKLIINGSTELPLPENIDSREKLDDFIGSIASMYGIVPSEMERVVEGDVVKLNNSIGKKG